MPELPEVETTRRGIAPCLLGRRVRDVIVREHRLRWPLSPSLPALLRGQKVVDVRRRAKYLLLGMERGTLIVHLGMSGSLRLAQPGEPPRKHDHVDVRLEDDSLLRFRDPRRFGSMHFVEGDPECHHLLAHLGVEPLEGAFDGQHLHRISRSRRAAVKSLLMDSRVVVGVGNIYASEALFLAGIHPSRPARRISLSRYHGLAKAVRAVLNEAIALGGTTLRDFVNGVGEPGYFEQQLRVYGRAGEPCRACRSTIRSRVIAQRNSYFCASCQR